MAGIHQERDRAESFGVDAERYDQTRPSYPSALIESLSANGVGTAVDVGCGTGQLTRLLQERGWNIKGVEADARMAAVARSHELDVDISTFETWDGPTNELDLICSAQAWHWIDPTVGYTKAAAHLAPGGTLALIWNAYHHTDAVNAVFDEVYGRYAPQLLGHAIHLGLTVLDHAAEDAAVEAHLGTDFDNRHIETFAHERRQSIEDWTAECLTHSPVALLSDETRTQLLADQANALRDVAGPTMQVRYTTRVTTARRV